MSQTQKEKKIEEIRGAYTGCVQSKPVSPVLTNRRTYSFGVVATLLEMVPVAGIFFAFTNTCAAALWAADMEKAQGTSPNLREQAEKAK